MTKLAALSAMFCAVFATAKHSQKHPEITKAVIVPLREEHDVTQDCSLAINGLSIRMGSVATVTNDNDSYVELSGGLGNLVLRAGDSIEVMCSNGRLYTSLYIQQKKLPPPPKKKKKLYIKDL